jgi:hypothetical protein
MLFVFLSLSTGVFDREKNSKAIESRYMCFSIRKGPLMAGFMFSVVMILMLWSKLLCLFSKFKVVSASWLNSDTVDYLVVLVVLLRLFDAEIDLSGFKNKKYSFSRMRVRASLRHFLRTLRTYLSSDFSGPERMKEQPSLA